MMGLGLPSTVAVTKCSTWNLTTTLMAILLLQLGIFTGTGSSSKSHYHSTQPLAAAGPRSSSFDYGARYRPPIVNLNYQGGPVMTQPINIYIVWYGSWADSEKNVIRTALSSLTPTTKINQFPNLSNLWKVVTKYSQKLNGQASAFVTSKVTIGMEVDDGFTATTIDSDNDPVLIIQNQIDNGNLPADYTQGVYFVLTASDISYYNNPSYCGYHSSSSDQNNLLYSFVALPAAGTVFEQGCNLFNDRLPGTPPNNDVSPDGALDSMISVIMHELLELSVDPYPGSNPAWLHNKKENSEIGDLCSYSFVADEWYYCDTPSLYSDFDTSRGQCMALASTPANGDPPRSLTDPKSGVIFNQYGVGGSQFMVQKIWSLDNKGCVVQQPEAQCPATTVKLSQPTGTIQRGFFFNGVGLQAYAPGQNCQWRITFSRQMKVTFTFDILALAYDNLDYIKLWQWNTNTLVKTLTGFGTNVEVTATGNDFGMSFVTYGGRSPYPISAGFIMHYTGDGKVLTWGHGGHGQLGHGDLANVKVPQKLSKH